MSRWAAYLRDMFRVVRPGGWCQLVELYHNAQSDNGSLTDGRFPMMRLAEVISDEKKSKTMHLGSGALDTSRV